MTGVVQSIVDADWFRSLAKLAVIGGGVIFALITMTSRRFTGEPRERERWDDDRS